MSKSEFVIGVGFGGGVLLMIGVAMATLNWPWAATLFILAGAVCLGVVITELTD